MQILVFCSSLYMTITVSDSSRTTMMSSPLGVLLPRSCIYLLVCAVSMTCVPPVGAENYLIGLLTPWNGIYEDFSGLTSASAVSIAMETIRDDPTISNNINLR